MCHVLYRSNGPGAISSVSEGRGHPVVADNQAGIQEVPWQEVARRTQDHHRGGAVGTSDLQGLPARDDRSNGEESRLGEVAGRKSEGDKGDNNAGVLQDQAPKPGPHRLLLQHGDPLSHARLSSCDAGEEERCPWEKSGDGCGTTHLELQNPKGQCSPGAFADDVLQNECDAHGRERGGDIWEQRVSRIGEMNHDLGCT